MESSLVEQIPSSNQANRWGQLRDLAKLTALKQAPDGAFHLGHWWRGPVLYSLVQQYKPRNILEFGTGRGYGAACMAQALFDAGLEGTIWTIDILPPEYPQEWPFDEGKGPELKQLALRDVWARHLPPVLTQKIRCLTGDSKSIMKQWHRSGLPKIDFCFIDGGHDYWTVKHDFIASLRVANAGCSFLFDDYTERRGYGVKRLIDREVAPKLPREAVEVIDTLSRDKTVYGEDVEHGMLLLRGEYIPPRLFYSRSAARRFQRQYWLHTQTRRLVSRVRALSSVLRYL